MTSLARVPYPKSIFKSLYDLIGLPLRCALLKDSVAENIGLTSLEQERINAVFPHIRGRALDIGAGNNRLMGLYKNGIGIDVENWGGGVVVVPDTAQLPFKDGEFDTVCMLACLNHIPTREATLKEVWRVLKPGGQCLITMINPVFGFLAHSLRRHDECHRRCVHKDELNGLWHPAVLKMLADAGFQVTQVQPFFYHLNRLYIAVKNS
jgi:SAM-dependent methyltransferase